MKGRGAQFVVTVFLYEYLTGGGLFNRSGPDQPEQALLREGSAMIEALASDFSLVPGIEVWLLRDARLPTDAATVRRLGEQVRWVHSRDEERQAIRELASVADWTLLIAPELDGALADRAGWVEQAGGRLLSPSAAFVAWTSDKHRTTLRLEQCGVRVPFGRHIETGQRLSADFPYPAIAKPIDGAGSFDTRRIENAAAASQWGVATRPWRLERFIPGLPASVATLCGPGRRQMLPACSQCISQDGEFRYLGGRTPLPMALDRRAQTLAAQALAAFAEPLVGYVGVDLILGPAEDGSEDFVLEINPRLTTSYVGLRRLCRTNLAAAMLAIATGEPVELAIDDCHVEFDSAGSVRLGRWRTTEPGW